MSNVNTTQPTPTQALCAGFVAGAVTPFSYQALWNVKQIMQSSNASLQQVASSWRGRSVVDVAKTLHTGIGANVGANGFLFAAGSSLDKFYRGVISPEGEPTFYEKTAAAVAAGVTLSPANTALENLMIQKGVMAKQAQAASLPTPNYVEVVKNMFHKEGVRAFTRGLVGTAIREGVFYVPAYAVMAPQFSNMLKEQGMESNVANIVGGMSAGAVAAILSHPADSWKTFVQMDMPRPTTFKPYMNGVEPRTVYAALATGVFGCIYSIVLEAMSKAQKS